MMVLYIFIMMPCKKIVEHNAGSNADCKNTNQQNADDSGQYVVTIIQTLMAAKVSKIE
jgi:hypothetical protein